MGHDKNKHHIIPLKVYFSVFGALMFLTALTVLTAQIDLTDYLGEGPYNIILAMFIAITKSTLVLLFFMHLYYDNKTNLIFFLASILFLCIFIVFTLMDVNTRSEIYKINGKSPYKSIQDLNRVEKTGGEHHSHSENKGSHH